MANLLSTSVAGQLTVNGGRLLLQTGGTNTYGIVSGYDNNNHFITMRGSVSGSTSSPTFGGAHQMTFVEYAQAGDDTGWYFKSSSSGTYEEIARITRSGINWSGNTIIHSGTIGSQSVNYATTSGNSATTSQRSFDYLYTTSYLESAGGVYGTIFYDNNDRAFYLDPNAGKSLRIAGGIEQNNLVGRPFAQWGQGGAATGAVVIKFPGDANNYGMVHAVVDIYEYNGNNVCTIIIGGHNWGNRWYAYGANMVGFTEKPVRVAFKDGKYAIVIGNDSSSWSYGQVVLRKIQNGSYYAGVMDVAIGYTVGIEPESSTWISEDLRGLRVGGPVSATNISTGVTANHIVQRDANGYIYANHVNFSTPESENPAISSFITSNGDGWSRKSSLAHVRNQLGNYGNWITTDGRAYPRRSDGTNVNFYWDGQGGQPTWLWGSNNGVDFYVWNPSNFSVNYASSSNTANYLPTLYAGGVQANPQTYFGQSVGLRVAMTGVPFAWCDTLWINGYSGGDVLSMCAIHTARNGQPRMWISSQNSNGSSYGTTYEVITSWNIASQSVSYADESGYSASTGTTDNIGGVQFRNTGSNAGTNADTIDSNGITYYTAGVANFSGNATDGALYSQRYSTSWQHQIAGDYRSGQIALRGRNNGTWQAWRTVLDSSNFTSWAQEKENQRLSTGNSPTFANVYATEWFRNYGNQGIYNQTYGTHFYSNAAEGFAITGSGGVVQLQFRSNHQSTLRGYVYADTSNNIGFLNDGGSWALRMSSTRNAEIFGSDLTIGAGGANATNIIMGDNDEGSRTIHCNSNRIGFLTQAGSWGAWLYDSADWEAGSSVRAPIFYDSDNTNRYLDLNSAAADAMVISGGIHISRDNVTGNGIILADDGDIVDLNDGYCAMRFSYGIRVHSGNRTGSAVHTLHSDGNAYFNTSAQTPIFLVNSHSDNTKGYRIYNTSNSSVSAMFVNSSNQLVIAAGAVDQINLNKKVYVNGVALGVNVAPSATAGRIDASNDIVAYSSSDERLKENITPIENALDKVKSLTGVEFDWKPEYKHAHGYEGHDTGIIAQQVEAIMPSAVRTNDTGFLAVRYEKLIGLLIEGMKEQQAQIDELKAKLDGIAS